MDQKELMQLLEEAQNAPVSYVDLKMATQRIKVDMDTRRITGYTEFGVIKDHLAENIIFEVKRYKGDTDLAEKHCAIHWENGKNGGVVPVTEVDLSEDGHILMRWELSDEFTQYAGSIAYALHFFSILDGGFTYHAATNAAVGTLGTTLNASAHSKNKITPSEIEVYIAKMNELSAAMDEQVVLAQEAATKAESVAAQLAEKTGQIDLNTQKNAQHSTEIATLTQSKADAITVEKSGTSIVATDSSDKGFEQFRTYGGSKQEKTSGNQLLDAGALSTTTITGITCEVLDDGGIHIEGTKASGDWKPSANKLLTLANGTYVLSHEARQGKLARIRLHYDSDVRRDYGNGEPFVIDGTEREISFIVQAEPNWTVNETIYPMLNSGSTPLPWEPYTGNIPSPNPEYPQPIVSAGQKLAKGVQLFDKDAVTPELLDISNGAALNNSDWRLSDYIACKSLTNYYISESIAQYWQFAACFYNTNKEFISGGYLADNNIATPANTAYMRVAYSVAVNGVSIDRGNIMLNKGTTALPYEPYTGGVKKAYDVGISKRLTGKNLLKNTAVSQTVNGVTFTVNEDGSVTANGTATAFVALSINSVTLSSGDYILSGCPNGGEWNTYSLQIDYDSQETGSGLNIAFSDNKKKNVRIAIYNGTTVSNLVFKPMLRLASIEDDTYEPYTEQTLTLNRVLRGIPLGTDIPEMFKSNALHMAGIYWDEKEQQYYIADTIDAERGVLVQRVGEFVFDGDENFVYDDQLTVPRVYSNELQSTAKKAPNNNIKVNAICDAFIVRSFSDASGNTNSMAISENGTISFFSDSFSSETELREHMAEHPITVIYELATPIETPLTDEEIIAYKTLHSNKPTTIITNDAGCFMEVEYVADTKTHIAQNYVPVTAFNNVLDRISALERLHV